MRPPPDQLSGRLAIMRNHDISGRSPACVATTQGGEIAGFATASTAPTASGGTTWSTRSLHERAGPLIADDWFGDALELAEIHVAPRPPEQGVGRA